MDSKGFKGVESREGIANAVRKADKFASQDVGATRAKAKQAILTEISSQMQVRAGKMKLLARAEEGLAQTDSNPYLPESFNSHYSGKLQSEEGAAGGNSSKLPVATARQRRRQQKAQSVTPHRTVNIKEYRPGYTWNRGGRVKELRIRCIARKFLFLWIRGVFGRVTLSKASAHYRVNLLRQTFQEWHEMWWENRREWRLMVRAECHHRYVVWAKLFSHWKQFVLQCRKQHSKDQVAENHYAKSVKKKLFGSWCSYIHSRQTKSVKKKMADELYMQNVVRHVWSCWQEHLSVINHRHQMEVVALQFWAYRIQVQHWLMWCEALMLRQKARLDQNRAANQHNVSMLKQTFRAWCRHTADRREKHHLRDYASTRYCSCVKQQAFSRWYDRWRLHLSMAQHEHQIRSKACRFQKLRAFVSWRHYIFLRHEEKEKSRMANRHYMKHLMVLGFSSFRLHAVQKRLKSMRLVIGQQLHQKQLLRWAWNTWIAQCDKNEEIKLIPKTRKAQNYHRQLLMRKTIHSMMEYTRWRQHRQAQYTRADAYYYVHAMPQYLFRMRVFVQVMKNNRENAEKAVDYRRENLQARFFFMWCNNFEGNKEYRMNERMAILHHEDTTIKSYFVDWRKRTVAAIEMAEREEAAAEHYCVHLKLSHLRAWKRYVEDLKHGQQNELKAARHVYRQCLSWTFAKWKKYTNWRSEKNRKRRQAEALYKMKACRRILGAWCEYTTCARSRHMQAEELYQLKCRDRQRHALIVWKENAQEQIKDREIEHTAKLHHHRQVLVKVLKTWHRFAAIHAYKKSETRKWVESAKEELRKKTLQRLLAKWRGAHDEVLLYKLRYEQAVVHHQQLVQRKVVHEWTQYTQISIRKHLLMKQSMWFHNVRLSAKFFLQWRNAHKEAVENSNKTSIALWHWSLVLQRKILVWWYEYIQERRRKKQRVAEAMERRRSRLLRDGVSQWLKVASDLTELRGKFAAQQQAKSAYDQYQLVQRCALHWKHWAARRKEIRGSTDHPRRTVVSKVQGRLQDEQPGRISPQQQFVQAGSQMPIQNYDSNLPPVIYTKSPLRPRSFGARQSREEESVFPVQQLRPKPRHPAFLAESLKRAGLYSRSDKELTSERQEQELEQDRVKMPRDLLQTESTELPARQPCTAKVFFESLQTDLNNQHRRVEKHVLNSSAIEETESSPRPCPPRPQLLSSFPPNDSQVEGGESFSPITREPQRGAAVTGYQQSYPGEQPVISGSSDSRPALLTPDDFMVKKTGDLYSESRLTQERLISLPAHSEIGSGDATNVNDLGIRSEAVSRVVKNDRTVFNPHQTYVKHTSGAPAGLVVNSDIVNIRNRLKTFDERKKRLRMLQKQKQQLVGWLEEVTTESSSQGDSDVSMVKHEVTELDSEIKHLKEKVEFEKPECAKLIQQVQELLQQLGPVA